MIMTFHFCIPKTSKKHSFNQKQNTCNFTQETHHRDSPISTSLWIDIWWSRIKGHCQASQTQAASKHATERHQGRCFTNGTRIEVRKPRWECKYELQRSTVQNLTLHSERLLSLAYCTMCNAMKMPYPICTSYQIDTCLKPHQSNIPKHLQEQVCPYKTFQYQEIQETLMAPFTEMRFGSSRLWCLQDLKNCNDMTSSTAVFRKGGNFFRKVRDICWWKQKTCGWQDDVKISKSWSGSQTK